MPKRIKDLELSDLSLSTDKLAQHHEIRRSQDERMMSLHFSNTVQSIYITPYLEIHNQPLNKLVFGKRGTYITISRRASAFTGFTKDELTLKRIKMANNARWKESALGRQILISKTQTK